MLTYDEVVRLQQDLAGKRVLSVYLNGEETNPAERRAWRTRFNGMLKELQDGSSDAAAAERGALQRAAELLAEALDGVDGLLPGRGWVGFATGSQLHYAGSTAAPMPDLVRWEAGPHVTPYVRALKQSRPVTAVVVDRRHARILRYQGGQLAEEQVLRSDVTEAEATPAGPSKRASTHSGVRGASRDDAARRTEEVSAQRMLREVVSELTERAREGHLLVVAGVAETTAALLRELPERALERTITASGVRTEASLAELKDLVESSASELSLRLQGTLVEQVLDDTRSAGRACVGVEPITRALQAGAVDTLLLSRAFARAQPDAAERLVDGTLEQGGAVEEVGGPAAAELDREGGVAARLRFTL